MSNLPESVCFYCADQNTHRDRSRGITRYTYGLLSHLRDTTQLRLSALVSKSSFPLPDGIERATLFFRSDHLPGRLAADHLHPWLAPRSAAALWHYPKGFLPFIWPGKVKKVGTVADVMLQHDADYHPESRSRAAWSYWLGLLKRSIRNLDVIITISDFSKHAILAFCDRHRIKPPPIVVAHLGVTISENNDRQIEPKEDYVVHLASRYPYKATRWLLEQWALLGQKKGALPMLRLVGELDARASALFSKMSNVSLTPPLERGKLESVISKARALLLPSEIEGFGIPAVEAYLLGTPVAYARHTALEEIIGSGSPGGFERETDSLASALQEVLELPDYAVQEKAEALRLLYNWNDCVSRTLEAYSLALNS